MATTTNYGWTTPDDTDLVKDGAAAIRTLGSSVDTTTKALNPSTTLGDIEYRSATANTNTRLGIGSTGNVLTVTGGVPVWAAPAAGGGITQIATGTLSGSSVVISGIAATYKNLVLVVQSFTASTSNQAFRMRLNGDTAAKYNAQTAAQGLGIQYGDTYMEVTVNPSDTGTTAFLYVDFPDYANTVTKKQASSFATYPAHVNPTTDTNYTNRTLFYDSTSAISSITMFLGSGTWSAGTYILYGVN